MSGGEQHTCTPGAPHLRAGVRPRAGHPAQARLSRTPRRPVPSMLQHIIVGGAGFLVGGAAVNATSNIYSALAAAAPTLPTVCAGRCRRRMDACMHAARRCGTWLERIPLAFEIEAAALMMGAGGVCYGARRRRSHAQHSWQAKS